MIFGTARHGTARHGTAWHGTAWQGSAWQARQGAETRRRRGSGCSFSLIE
ncbi:hypothetical protein MT356_14675 [Rathayibacter festucae]|nr:hypothetical protein [Rathayibacter festucae]MCJ1700963.1 hypothetical protein [Rathayibacter festucae]